MASPDTPKYRLNPSPRISANQLAEYTLASPSRRQSILRNAKFAPTFLVIRYSEARKAICNFLADDSRPIAKLLETENAQTVKSQGGGSAFKKNDAMLSAEAIKEFRKILNGNKLPKTVVFEKPKGNFPKLDIGGVDISISLDLIAKNNGNGGVGGVLVQTSKAIAAKSWRADHSRSVASLVWMLSAQCLADVGKVDRKYCFSIDLFGQSVTSAPQTYKRRLNDIEASCSEISALWDSISPPSDFDG